MARTKRKNQYETDAFNSMCEWQIEHLRSSIPSQSRSKAIRAALVQAGLLPVEPPQTKTPTAA